MIEREEKKNFIFRKCRRGCHHEIVMENLYQPGGGRAEEEK